MMDNIDELYELYEGMFDNKHDLIIELYETQQENSQLKIKIEELYKKNFELERKLNRRKNKSGILPGQMEMDL